MRIFPYYNTADLQRKGQDLDNSLFLAETRECRKLMRRQEPPEGIPRHEPGNEKKPGNEKTSRMRST
jgi:hypothetical protein